MTTTLLPADDREFKAARDVLVRRYWQPSLARALDSIPMLGYSMALLAAAPRQFWGERAVTTRRTHVHAVGIGGKNGGDERAVVVYVTHKLPKSEVPSGEMIPETIDGIRTDVVESRVPRLAACTDQRTAAHRPLIAGVSVGRKQGPSGTIAAFARSTKAGDPAGAILLLSNSHVLAAGKSPGSNVRIVQPGVDDGQGGAVGTLLRATRLTIAQPIAADAAVATLDPDAAIRNEICSIGRVSGVGAPADKDRVEKHGRTTGLSAGVITTTGLAAEALDSKGRRLQFLNVFRVERAPGDAGSLAQLGDSGALVVRMGSSTAVGMLYAVDEQAEFYLAHPIKDVCTELEIELNLD